MDCFDAANIVKIAGILVVRYTLREDSFDDEVASLLVEILLKIAPNDDVHSCCLSNLVLLQAAIFVSLEHCRSELEEHFLLLVSD